MSPSPTRSTDITSFTEHRRRLRDHIEQVRQSGRPLYVTTNGVPDAVVVSPETYDELVGKAELVDSLLQLDRSVAEVRDGETVPAKAAILRIAEELGIQLDR